jgi:7-carboxy-7-deazaguanine synthase
LLKVNEIFYSIQGESSLAGRPCTFIRLAGCNLRCKYCDTDYAYGNGILMSKDQVLRTVAKYDCPLVLITGGEPLMQEESFPLMDALLEHEYQVMLETNGSLAVQNVPEGVLLVMDIKCPGSGEMDKNLYTNIDYLGPADNCKFVITDRRDYEWASDVLFDYGINELCEVLMSPCHGMIEPRELAEWILKDHMPVRLQLQLHKMVWGPDVEGR